MVLLLLPLGGDLVVLETVDGDVVNVATGADDDDAVVD